MSPVVVARWQLLTMQLKALTSDSDLSFQPTVSFQLMTHDFQAMTICQVSWYPYYITMAWTTKEKLLPKIPLSMRDVLIRLLLSNGPGIFDEGDMFWLLYTRVYRLLLYNRWLLMTNYSGFQPPCHIIIRTTEVTFVFPLRFLIILSANCQLC